jgi:hypothetical protein
MKKKERSGIVIEESSSWTYDTGLQFRVRSTKKYYETQKCSVRV